MIQSVQIKGGKVYVVFSGNGEINFTFFWLRDNCRCESCYNFETFQRIHSLLDIPEDAQPEEITQVADKIKIIWTDGHVSEYASSFLRRCWRPTWQESCKRHPSLWRGPQVEENVVTVQRDDFLQSEETLKRFLESMVRYGAAFVEGVAPTMEDTELVIKRVGPVQKTLFGEMWKFTSDQARADSAYSTLALGPHTDNTYFTEAAGIQVLHCLEHDGTGGENLLLDGFQGVEELRRQDLDAFETLCTLHQPAEYLEKGWHHTHAAPVISINSITGEIQQIRYNEYDRSPQCAWSSGDVTRMYSALRSLSRIYNDPEVQWWFKLRPGRVLFFDNWRLLHGRAGFSGRRVVGGGYLARADWLSAARLRGVIE